VRPELENINVWVQSYEASEGKEFFISAEDKMNDVLVGYLRLRFPSEKAHRPEISEENVSLIRELRVCGDLVPVGRHSEEAFQHRGWGRKLIEEAERISRENGFEKILVTSALGTKEYYKRLGFTYDGVYMGKKL